MPASDLTCFDPPSPSQPTPAPPAMSARSHHALSPPRTTRFRPIRANLDNLVRQSIGPADHKKSQKTPSASSVGLLRRPRRSNVCRPSHSSVLPPISLKTSTDLCRHHRLYRPLRASPPFSHRSHPNRRPTPNMQLAQVLPALPHVHPSRRCCQP